MSQPETIKIKPEYNWLDSVYKGPAQTPVNHFYHPHGLAMGHIRAYP